MVSSMCSARPFSLFDMVGTPVQPRPCSKTKTLEISASKRITSHGANGKFRRLRSHRCASWSPPLAAAALTNRAKICPVCIFCSGGLCPPPSRSDGFPAVNFVHEGRPNRHSLFGSLRRSQTAATEEEHGPEIVYRRRERFG